MQRTRAGFANSPTQASISMPWMPWAASRCLSCKHTCVEEAAGKQRPVRGRQAHEHSVRLAPLRLVHRCDPRQLQRVHLQSRFVGMCHFLSECQTQGHHMRFAAAPCAPL